MQQKYCSLISENQAAILWLGGDVDPRTGKRKFPTLHLTPLELAKAYGLDEPCRITLEGKPELGGILIKWFGPPEPTGANTTTNNGSNKPTVNI